MASKNFLATWMGQYRADNATYVGGSNPIRTGGSPWYHSYIGIDKTGILNAINTSKTAARVYLNFYSTNGAEFDVGFHKEGSNKASNGMPFYRYANIHPILGTGWQRIDLTDAVLQTEGTTGFKNIMNAGYTGPVLYGGRGADQGEAYGVTNNQFHLYIEVTGTWNTPPGKPTITAPTAGTRVDKTFELKATAATDAEQTASQLDYNWQIYDGTTWHDLGWTVRGAGPNRVVDFSSYPETDRAQVSVRAGDGQGAAGAWAYSSNFTIAHNKPPGAPTDLSPVGGSLHDRTKSITFSWVHNDADGQTAYEFRWRQQGLTLWNESGKIVTTSKNRVVAANTFPLGTIEWQVRTYDQGNLVGDWSATALFSATEPSDAPTITSPSMSAVIPTSRVNMSWTAPAQDEYHVQLVDINNMILWEDDQVSSNQTIDIPYDLVNNSTYRLRVQVATTGELFSSWAESTFTTSFTTPAVPIVELFEWQDEGAVDVRITNPISGEVGEPTVTYNDIYRRVYAAEDSFIRIATNVSNNGVFRDYTPAAGVSYEYVIRAWGDNGTFQDSETSNVSITIDNTMISIASNPTRFVRLQYNPSRSEKRSNTRSMLQFNGRKNPVAEFGIHQTVNLDLDFDVKNQTELEVLMDIIDSQETLLYRDSRGRKEFVTVDTLSITDKFPKGYSVSFSPEKVEFIEEV
ncbi:hypothetical protein ACSU6B_23160 [Neobacillus sp. C211]|uniref:hypothetical protein n=1 Tax=unclassified Neobacillus TaxID=2675272 RepID=UPI00397A791F